MSRMVMDWLFLDEMILRVMNGWTVLHINNENR